MKEFAYQRANDVDSALALLGQPGSARFLAGGTNLVDLMKTGVEYTDRLIDIRALPLNDIDVEGDGSIQIGAMVTNSDLAAHPEVRRRYPALSQAILAGASGQLRNAATVAGNLLQRTRCAYFANVSMPCNKRQPGSGCPAVSGENHNHAILGWTSSCVATHPSDMAVPLAAFDARVSFVTARGRGELSLDQLYLPVGSTPHVETALPAGALITGVTLPVARIAVHSRYRKVRERASYAFATGSIAAALDVRDGRVADARIALGAVAARPWRAHTAEAELRGKPADRESFVRAADAELAAARPLRGNAYKLRLARNLILTTLSELVESQGDAA
ncbi:xanthine dehydrogenase family protein subunit M [Streptomyces sp. S1D4-11]|nr:xanthine dehydrogenase family protein subunit M [Streptomyces sp. S1D4-11]QIZ01087.1 xanthine dehydrogenase family protein subunit M [Streptomyces sp. S1D4-11]